MRQIYEKKHRLPPEHYWGLKRVSFTACIQRRKCPFLDPTIVHPFQEALQKWTLEKQCIASIYCFMPDHLHVILAGTREESRPKEAMDEFKETTGTWFAKNRPEFKWQKNYHDHIIRISDDWKNHVRYVLRNPVRAGLVDYSLDYPFLGSIGPRIEEVLMDEFTAATRSRGYRSIASIGRLIPYMSGDSDTTRSRAYRSIPNIGD